MARAPALQAGGQRFESVILHLVRAFLWRGVRSLTCWHKQHCAYRIFSVCASRENEGKASKGAWWMPRLTEATKGVVSCEKPRVGANGL